MKTVGHCTDGNGKVCAFRIPAFGHILLPAVQTVLFVQMTFYFQDTKTGLVLDDKGETFSDVVMSGIIYSMLNG